MSPEKPFVGRLVTRTRRLWYPNVTKTSAWGRQKTHGSSILHLHPPPSPCHLAQMGHHKSDAMPARHPIGEPHDSFGTCRKPAPAADAAGRIGPPGPQRSPAVSFGTPHQSNLDAVSCARCVTTTTRMSACWRLPETRRMESDPSRDLAPGYGEQRHVAVVVDVIDGRPELMPIHCHPDCA